MTTFKRPSCNAKLDVPDTGRMLTCKYCGDSIKPVDIFEKIKSLIE